MPLAELTIDLPEGTWVHDVSMAHPGAAVRVLSGMPGEDVGFALVEVTAPDLESVLRAMIDHEALTDIEPLQRGDGRVLLQIESTAPLLLLSAQASGVPIEPPVHIVEGVAEIEVRTSHDRLSSLGEQLERFGLSYTVKAVHEGVDPESILSDHQAELLVTACQRGYYDTPRRCSLTDLADAVGIAKSTCSETLHRAEGHVIRRFVENHLATTSELETEEPTLVATRS